MIIHRFFRYSCVFVFVLIFVPVHGATEQTFQGQRFEQLVNNASRASGDRVAEDEAWLKVEEAVHRGVISRAQEVWCENGCCGDDQCCQTCAFECRDCCPLDCRMTYVTSARHSACMRSCARGVLSEGCNRAWRFLCGKECGLSCSLKTSPCKWACETFVCRCLTTKFYREMLCKRTEVDDGTDCIDKVWGCLPCPLYFPRQVCCSDCKGSFFCPETKRCCCRSAVPDSLTVAIKHFGERGKKDVLEQLKILVALDPRYRMVDLRIVIARMKEFGVDSFIRMDGELRIDAYLLAQSQLIGSRSADQPLEAPKQHFFYDYGATVAEQQAELKRRQRQVAPLLEERHIASRWCQSRVHAAAAWVAKRSDLTGAAKDAMKARSTAGLGIALLFNTLKALTNVVARGVEWHTALNDDFDLRRSLVMSKMQYVRVPGCNLERLAAITSSWTDDQVIGLLDLIIGQSKSWSPLHTDIQVVVDAYQGVWGQKKALVKEKFPAGTKHVSFYEPTFAPGPRSGFSHKVSKFLEVYNLPGAIDAEPPIIARFAQDIADYTGSLVCLFKAAECVDATFDFGQTVAALKELAGENALILVDQAHLLQSSHRANHALTGYITTTKTIPIIVTSTSTTPLFGQYRHMLDAQMGEFEQDRRDFEADLYEGVLMRNESALRVLGEKIAGGPQDAVTAVYNQLRNIALGVDPASDATRLLTLSFLGRAHARGAVAGYSVPASLREANAYFSLVHSLVSPASLNFKKEQDVAGFEYLSRQLMRIIAELRAFFISYEKDVRDLDKREADLFGGDPVDRQEVRNLTRSYAAVIAEGYGGFFESDDEGEDRGSDERSPERARLLADRVARDRRYNDERAHLEKRMVQLLEAFNSIYPRFPAPPESKEDGVPQMPAFITPAVPEMQSRGAVWGVLLEYLLNSLRLGDLSLFGRASHWDLGDLSQQIMRMRKTGVAAIESEIIKDGVSALGLPSTSDSYRSFFSRNIQLDRPEVLFLLLNLCLLAEIKTDRTEFDWLLHIQLIYQRLSELAKGTGGELAGRLKDEFLMLYFDGSESNALAYWRKLQEVSG